MGNRRTIGNRWQTCNWRCTIKGAIVEQAIVGKRAIDEAQKQSKRQMDNRRTIKGAIVKPAILSKRAIIAEPAIVGNRSKQSKRQMGNRCTVNLAIVDNLASVEPEMVVNCWQLGNRRRLRLTRNRQTEAAIVEEAIFEEAKIAAKMVAANGQLSKG